MFDLDPVLPIELDAQVGDATVPTRWGVRPPGRAALRALRALDAADPDAQDAYWTAERLAEHVAWAEGFTLGGKPFEATAAGFDGLYGSCPPLYVTAVRAVLAAAGEAARKNAPTSSATTPETARSSAGSAG